MAVSIPYGNTDLTIEIPPGRLLGLLQPRKSRPLDLIEAIRRVVNHPPAGPALRDFAQPGEPVLVIVNDATRPTPTAAMLKALWDDVCSWNLSFLVATGAHRPPAEEELQQMFGVFWSEIRGRVAVHDARRKAGLVFAGKTAAGTEVFLNREAMAAPKILVLGSVEAHYFAGYTGGRKIVMPGIAGFSTIEQNHKLALDPAARALVLEGNPVHADMDEALGFLLSQPQLQLFAVQAVLDRNGGLYHAAAGDIRSAFALAAPKVDELFAVSAPRRADIVIAVMTPPLDIDFYQSQKGIENGRLILNDGGILIIVSACRDGVGNGSFLSLMRRCGSPAEVMDRARSGYRLGYHKGARLAQTAQRAQIWAVAGVEAEVPRAAFMRPVAGLQEAVDEALQARPDGKVWVLMDAGVTVPQL